VTEGGAEQDSPYLIAFRDLAKVLVESLDLNKQRSELAGGTRRPLRVHLSSWAGKSEHMVKLLNAFPLDSDCRLYLGMNGLASFSKAKCAHECAFDVPLDRLVLETNAPRTTPAAVANELGRESFCHPGLLHFVAAAIANHRRDTSANDVAKACTANIEQLYPILAKDRVGSLAKK